MRLMQPVRVCITATISQKHAQQVKSFSNEACPSSPTLTFYDNNYKTCVEHCSTNPSTYAYLGPGASNQTCLQCNSRVIVSLSIKLLLWWYHSNVCDHLSGEYLLLRQWDSSTMRESMPSEYLRKPEWDLRCSKCLLHWYVCPVLWRWPHQ